MVMDLVRPFLSFLPGVETANRKVPLREKAIYTAISLFIFLVCSHLPLYGIHSTTGADPFYWKRVIFASKRGTVMELGITPIVTLGLVIELLAGSKIIEVDNNVPQNRALLNDARKLLGILIVVVEAVAYVSSGMYGSVCQLGVGKAILTILQLCFGGVIVISLDELLQKGYGLCSGIPLFIAASICGSVSRKAFEVGAIVLREENHRQNTPSSTNLLTTVSIILIVMYFHGFRVVRSNPPKMPFVYQSALVLNLYFISKLLYGRFGGNSLL
ncbi:hypothetical protein ACP275_08G198300 [Erythranthe tilingii]